jgi:DNA methylase
MTASDHASKPEQCPLLSVLVTGQKPSRVQRKGRYTQDSMEHPAKMLPSVAAAVISAYSAPGDFVLDPMCGIGTTLVEAIHQSRHAYGIEYEQRWAQLASANIRLAGRQGAAGMARVIRGDARRVARLVPEELYGRVALVLTSPPYGASTHGHVRSTRDSGEDGIRKFNTHYSDDPANLAHRRLDSLLDGFAQILTGCAQVMQPGGIVAVTVRPFRVRGELVDLPGKVTALGERAGLVLVDRLVTLLCGLREGQLVNRTSFFQMLETRRARDRGLPVCATAHEDLLVFQTPTRDGQSEIIEESESGRTDVPPTTAGPSPAKTGQRIRLDDSRRAERPYGRPASAGPAPDGTDGAVTGDGCGAERPADGPVGGRGDTDPLEDARDTRTPPHAPVRPDNRTGAHPGRRRNGGMR